MHWMSGTRRPATRHPPLVLSAITNNDSISQAFASHQQYRAGITGKAFDLPGGPVQVAFGGEYFRQQLSQHRATANNTGPASIGSSEGDLSYHQNVNSAYGEVAVPIVGQSMAVPACPVVQFPTPPAGGTITTPSA